MITIPKYKKRKASFEPFESSKPNENYTRITHSMLDSVAWNEISVYAHEVYIRMKRKYSKNQNKGTDNADNISLTYAEASSIMNKKTFTKALDELIDYGFIKLVILGRIVRKTNIYGFSDMWKYYNTDRFQVVSRPKAKSKPLLKAIK